jgi:uncharacterized protein YceH (UPF0502 family)
MDADEVELRVLGSLIEKQRTTPDTYPLSLNALRLACNQATNRDPVVDYDEATIRDGLHRLANRGWTRLASGPGSRVAKYRQLFEDELSLVPAETALLAVLMLRGPQTISELRTNSERLHRFADHSAVEGFLDELATRPEGKGGPLAIRLARAPGAREARWAQLLTGPVEAAALAGATTDDEDFVAVSELAALKARLAVAEAEIVALRTLLERVCAELDISRT